MNGCGTEYCNSQQLIDVPHGHVGPLTRHRNAVAVQQVSQPLLSSLSAIEMLQKQTEKKVSAVWV